MAPSIFSRQSGPIVPPQHSQAHVQDIISGNTQKNNISSTMTNRQKLKSISSFFSNNNNQNSKSDESHVIPYKQPEFNSSSPSRINISHSPIYDGLPLVKNGSTLSLPLNKSPSPNCLISESRKQQEQQILKVEILQKQNQENSSENRISYTSHNLQAQISREIPTLASAIHIYDSSSNATSSTSTNNSRNPSITQNNGNSHNGIHPLYHLNTNSSSSTSLLGSYVQINEIIPQQIINVNSNSIGLNEKTRGRSNSKSLFGSNNNNQNDEEGQGHGGTVTKRRMSRRLSLDNIVPKITGSLRKRERSSSRSGSIVDQGNGNGEGKRWSLFNNNNNNKDDDKPTVQSSMKPSTAVHQQQPLGNRNLNSMAMPVSRNWRNKFTVNSKLSQNHLNSSYLHKSADHHHNNNNNNSNNAGGNNSMPTTSRIEAARQARDRSRMESYENREKYDERTIKRIPVRGINMRDPSLISSTNTNTNTITTEGLPDKSLREEQSMLNMNMNMNLNSSLIGQTKERERESNATRLSFVRRPSSIASSFDPAATPKSTASIPIANTTGNTKTISFIPTGPPSANTVNGLAESKSMTSLAATAYDSPSPLPRPLPTNVNVTHTPLMTESLLNRLNLPTNVTQKREEELLFSPAQDDRSILDPARSPYPIPDASPLVPLNVASGSGIQYQNMPLPPPPINQNNINGLTESTRFRNSIQRHSFTLQSQDQDSSTVKPEKNCDSMDLSSLNRSLDEIASEIPNKSSSLISAESSSMKAEGFIANDIIAQPSYSGTFGDPATLSEESTGMMSTSASRQFEEGKMAQSISTKTLLPRSKSKSHTDLSSYSSSKNLNMVDQLEATQGEGWWSIDKKLNQRMSTLTLRLNQSINSNQSYSQSSILPYKSTFQDNDNSNDEMDILINDRSSNEDMEIMRSPTLNRLTEKDKLKTRSSLDLRSSFNSKSDSSNFASENVVQKSNNTPTAYGQNARPSLMAGSIWSKDQSHTLSSPTGKRTEETPNKEKRPEKIPLPPSEQKDNIPQNKTLLKNTFISNKISPDIARRASFLSLHNKFNISQLPTPAFTQNTLQSEINSSSSLNGSPSRSISRQTQRTLTTSTLSIISNSTAPTSNQSQSSQQSDDENEEDQSRLDVKRSDSGKVEAMRLDYEAKILHLKSRHQLEIDAVLNSLQKYKNENQSLRDDNMRLNQLNNVIQIENQNLKEKVRILCSSLQQIEIGSSSSAINLNKYTHNGGIDDNAVNNYNSTEMSMRRSDSVVSSLLPELINHNHNNIQGTSSRRNSSYEDDIDEFGRKPLPKLPLNNHDENPLTSQSISNLELRNKGIMKALSKNRRSSNNFLNNNINIINNNGSIDDAMEKRIISGNSIMSNQSNILYDDELSSREEDEHVQEEGWTLRLKEMDERYLDDM
ncbi:uncharacterized protein L201_007618 [Kwoniella dendrophila CBS 6074]|uniref:Uncharacterized protein n=1 Tax=Kwoniella dendrophila CBS 6074 TaxID=1295534 RepID=A0AAX4K6A6_9TREE